MGLGDFEVKTKFVYGLIGAISAIVSIISVIYTLTRPVPNLTAYVRQYAFVVPPQFKDNLSPIKDYIGIFGDSNLDYLINGISGELDVYERKKIIEKIQPLVSAPFAAPFEQGLNSYNNFISLNLHNSGDAIAKDIYIDFPETVLIAIIDDKKDVRIEKTLLKRINIQSIKQNGLYRILVWGRSSNLDYKSIIIGSDNSVAKMKYFEEFYGMPSFLARNAREVLLIISIMSVFLISSFFYFVYGLIASNKS
ncbi:hypothetical protein [Pectobacterium brasiliense]|uniref:hypothetical protein n=1 Tax=Pectobacterium brasiliense TaxID=180957 RepID=UPI0032EB75FF